MKKLALLGACALLATPAAFAGEMGQVTVYGTQSKIDMSGAGGGSADGIGYGLNGWVMLNQQFFVHGEYQANTLEPDGGGADLDAAAFRVGGGVAGEIQKGAMWLAKVEYVNFTIDTVAAVDGFGAHLGGVFNATPELSFMATVGYLSTSGDDDNPPTTDIDVKGLEYNIGTHFAFTKEFGLGLDYRIWKAEMEGGGSSADVDVSDIRLGATFSF